MKLRAAMLATSLLALTLPMAAMAQTLVATSGVRPNIEGQLAQPVRYKPVGDAFVIETPGGGGYGEAEGD